MEMSTTVRRNDGCSANGQEVTVAFDHVAHDGVAFNTRNAGSGQYDVRREFAIGDVERARCDRRRTRSGHIKRTQPVNACEYLFVDLEFSVVRDIHGDASEVALQVVERPNGDVVAHLVLADADERAANPDVLLIHGRNFREDKLFGQRVGRRRHDIDRVRRFEVEIKLQQRRAAPCHDQSIAIREVDPEFCLRQNIAGHIFDDRFLRNAGGLNVNLCARVVEANSAGHVSARWHGRGGYQFGQVDIVGKIDACRTRQCLDDAAVGHFEFE